MQRPQSSSRSPHISSALRSMQGRHSRVFSSDAKSKAIPTARGSLGTKYGFSPHPAHLPG